jgi:hypothetical protein
MQSSESSVAIYAYLIIMFGSFLPSLWSLSNDSLLGSRSRHCYAIKVKYWNGTRQVALSDPGPGQLRIQVPTLLVLPIALASQMA